MNRASTKDQDRATLRLIRDLAMLYARAETYALPGSGSNYVLAFELEWIAEDLENLAGAARAIAEDYDRGPYLDELADDPGMDPKPLRPETYAELAEKIRRTVVAFFDPARASAAAPDPVGSGSEER